MKKRKTILTLCLLCATSLAATAYVKASWEGWDTEKQDDAWTVLDLTEWTEFASLGTIPSVITTYSATASVNTAVRDYEAQIKAEFKSYSQDYSGYTELLLAICVHKDREMTFLQSQIFQNTKGNQILPQRNR